MATTTPGFDPETYKETTRRQWDAAADAWHGYGAVLSDWLGAATAEMLDAAEVGVGDRVLDVAAGAGQQSLAAARRVGPSGHVLATDISAGILELAARDARAAGLTNVETRRLDGERLDAVEEASFDACISRLGLIYLPDQVGALRGMRRALRAGGRVAAVVYAEADRNAFFAVPVGIIRRRAGLPAPAPGQPGPFSLGDPATAERVLAAAGLREVRTRRIPAPLRMPTAEDCVRFERASFGALHQMMAGLDEGTREDTWREIGDALGAYEGAGGFEGPCELVVVSGVR